MAILTKSEFFVLETELEEIKKLIGKKDKQELLSRVQKIIDRLDDSKASHIKRANLRLVQ